KKQVAQLTSRIRQLEKSPAAAAPGSAAADPRAIDRAVKTATAPLRKALEAVMKFIVNVSAANFDIAGVDKAELEKAVLAAVDRATSIVDQRLANRQKSIERLRKSAKGIEALLRAALDDDTPVEINVAVQKNEPFTVKTHATRPAPRPQRVASGSGDGSLGKGEKVVLTAIAPYPDGALRDQLTVLTGYKRSSRDTYIQRLASAGFVEIQGNSLRATDAGIDALGSDFEPLPQGEQLQEYWLARLPEGERKILEPLIAAYPDAVSRESLEETTGYKRSSRDTYIQRLSSRRLVENVGRGEVRASENLFEGALV
ncbi:MAG: hypothetical protein ACRD3J_18240, partial [Thermoanaerobaculia bacterium]